MTHLILTADPLGLAATGVASYLFYVRAVCYAIAAVICIVGALSVYSDMMRLAFSCVFLVTASTALPRFFGLDATTAELSSGGGSSSDDNSPRQIGTGIIGIGDPYVIQLPDGGRGIIWGRDRRM